MAKISIIFTKIINIFTYICLNPYYLPDLLKIYTYILMHMLTLINTYITYILLNTLRTKNKRSVKKGKKRKKKELFFLFLVFKNTK